MNYQERLQLIDKVSERIANGESEESLRTELSETLYGKDVKDVMFQASKEIKANAKSSIKSMLVSGNSIEEAKAAHPNISTSWFEDIIRNIKADSFHELKSEMLAKARRGDKPHTWAIGLTHPCLSQSEIDAFATQLVNEKIEMSEAAQKSANSGIIIAVLGIAISLGSIIYAASDGGGGRIFYGAIIGGLYMAYKGFTAKD